MLPELSVLEPDKNDPEFLDNQENFLYEPKFNGIRVLLYFERDSEDVGLFSRKNMAVKTYSSFRDEIKSAISPVCRNVILDGELIAVDKDHLAGNYDALQERSTSKCILQFRCFDILYYNDVDIRGYNLMERKKALTQKFGSIKTVQFKLVPYADSIPELPAYSNLEGHVAKQKSSKYESGRQRTWIKIKKYDTEMVMCTGFSEGLGYMVNHVGNLNIAWILHDPKSKSFTLKDAGYVNDFVTLDAHLKIEAYIRKMTTFKQFPIEISYLRKNADGRAYHATFHKIVSLED